MPRKHNREEAAEGPHQIPNRPKLGRADSVGSFIGRPVMSDVVGEVVVELESLVAERGMRYRRIVPFSLQLVGVSVLEKLFDFTRKREAGRMPNVKNQRVRLAHSVDEILGQLQQDNKFDSAFANRDVDTGAIDLVLHSRSQNESSLNVRLGDLEGRAMAGLNREVRYCRMHYNTNYWDRGNPPPYVSVPLLSVTHNFEGDRKLLLQDASSLRIARTPVKLGPVQPIRVP